MPSIATIMHKHIVGVAVGTSLKAAIRLMKLNRVSLVPVLKEGKLMGILTLSMAERRIHENENASVGEAMEAPFAYISMDSSMEEASRLLVSNKITRLPVVDSKKDMKCVGIVTSTDLVAAAD